MGSCVKCLLVLREFSKVHRNVEDASVLREFSKVHRNVEDASEASHSWFQVGCVAQRLLGGVGKPAPVRERGRKPRRTAASSAASHLLHDLMSILSCGERALWVKPRVPAPCAAPMVCRGVCDAFTASLSLLSFAES